jgi:hypothetical protein
LAKNLIELLDTYELKRKIVTSIEDEGLNVKIMIASLKSIVSCDVLGLEEIFQGTCFGRAFFKTCQYATMDDFFYKNLKHYEKLCMLVAHYLVIKLKKKLIYNYCAIIPPKI